MLWFRGVSGQKLVGYSHRCERRCRSGVRIAGLRSLGRRREDTARTGVAWQPAVSARPSRWEWHPHTQYGRDWSTALS